MSNMQNMKQICKICKWQFDMKKKNACIWIPVVVVCQICKKMTKKYAEYEPILFSYENISTNSREYIY